MLNKHKNKIKFYASKPMMAGMISMIVLAYALFLFVIIYDVINKRLFANIWEYLALICFLVIFPTLVFAFTAHRWFTVIEIDEHGIKTSLFHFFNKKFMAWDELKEIRYVERIFPFVFISKNVSLANMYYEKIIKQKDVIQVSLTPKVYSLIKGYYPKAIEGLTDLKIKQLNLDK